QRFNNATAQQSAIELARTGLDLIIPSVLVDAGAGANWNYRTSSGILLSRSEGLGIASLEMFLSGTFSADSSRPLRTDAEALVALDLADFADRMQSTEEKPLIGLENRLLLLQQLGRLIQHEPKVFPNARLGDLADYLTADSAAEVSATRILSTILRLLSSMWPKRITVSGVNLGDAWWYSPPNERHRVAVPFHKLSQWLTYSIAETLLRSGWTVCDVEQLTGLAEYRNGGLFIDSGVLRLKEKFMRPSYRIESRAIVEWRALTVYLLDRTAERVQSILGQELSLPRILEGGTWHVGRELAYERSPSGDSPLQIDSDGTVF
ncbi:MAG: URC4/urg3 family protein, partial [Gammaproteobacteria bacterium]|nr:URC4/urg3 family protein [Gammaproteobacteria bacterium]